MKINFIGSPSSGKTTVAALAFSKLKNLGFYSEFVTEQARLYISEIRYNSKNQGNISLKDEDQLVIMTRQLRTEVMVEYSVNGIGDIICDSSPLNALFYMSPEFRQDKRVKALVSKTLETVGTVFYCEPAENFSIMDPNRLHSLAQSSAIDSQIMHVLKECCPEFVNKVKRLSGTAEQRAARVTNLIVEAK